MAVEASSDGGDAVPATRRRRITRSPPTNVMTSRSTATATRQMSTVEVKFRRGSGLNVWNITPGSQAFDDCYASAGVAVAPGQRSEWRSGNQASLDVSRQ